MLPTRWWTPAVRENLVAVTARDDTPQPVNNEAWHRFELSRDGALAELVYERDGDQLVLVHTGVPDALEGRGIGGLLVRAAIDVAEREHLVVVPKCPFARGWLERHPDVAARVRIDWPRAERQTSSVCPVPGHSDRVQDKRGAGPGGRLPT
jgi:predicted GNAT family acetyltransferase